MLLQQHCVHNNLVSVFYKLHNTEVLHCLVRGPSHQPPLFPYLEINNDKLTNNSINQLRTVHGRITVNPVWLFHC